MACGVLTLRKIAVIIPNVIFELLHNEFSTKGTNGEWISGHWYFVVIFAITVAIPYSCLILFRFCVITDNTVNFHYCHFMGHRNKYIGSNIDITWNQNVVISEVKDTEIVKLTEEEKQTKVFYKHWFNKYLKVNLEHDASKYIYIGNYSNNQIKKIMRAMNHQ